MIRNFGDGRSLDARTTFAITTAWLVGVIMAATYMNFRDAGAIATDVANAASRRHAVGVTAPAHGTLIAPAYGSSTDPIAIAARRTLRARALATAPKRYGCLAVPTTIATTSWGPITFACPVGVSYKTIVHDDVARRTHVGITRTIALHPGVMQPGDSVRYDLVRPR